MNGRALLGKTIAVLLAVAGGPVIAPRIAVAEEPAPGTYVVQPNDSLYRIGQRFGLSVDELARLNNLSEPYFIAAGDVLRLEPNVADASRRAPTPDVGESTGAIPGRMTYVVKPGDNLFRIGLQYGFTVEEIAALNNLSPPYLISVGDVLVVETETAAIVREQRRGVEGGQVVPPAFSRGARKPVPEETPPEAPPPAETPVAQAPTPPRKKSVLSEIDFGLLATARTALETRSGDSQLTDFRVEPSLRVPLIEGWALYGKGRFLADASDNIEPGRPSQVVRGSANRRILLGDRAEAELREAYLQGRALDVDWTIGKQAIVWGESDGLKVLDVVNPQSYREFILADYEDSRIPLWSARAEKRIKSVTAEGIVIFDNTYNEFPGPGAAFDVTTRTLSRQLGAQQLALLSPGATLPVVLHEPSRDGAANSPDYGFRAKTFFKGWDLSVLYFRHTEDNPVVRASLTPFSIDVRPFYDRVNLFGATFANAVGDFTFRGELGYYTGRGLRTLPDAAGLAAGEVGGLVERDQLSYVLGLDYYGVRDTLFSAQFFQNAILNAPGNLVDPQNTYSATFYVRRMAMNERFQADFQAIVNLREGDTILRPRVKYDFRDDLTAYLAGDIFIGSTASEFGQFRDSSRVVLGVEYRM